MEPIAAIIPLYNKERYIERALRTVLDQTRRAAEVVVVDDGSTDGGPAVVEGFTGRGVKLIRQENAGPSAARNRGLASTTAPWVTFLDADDEWRHTFLERLSCVLEQFPVAGFACSGLVDGRTGAPILPSEKILGEDTMEGIIPRYFQALHHEYFLNPSSALIRRSAIGEAGAFDECARWGEDPDFFGRLALRYPVAYVADALAVHHREADGRHSAHGSDPSYPPFVVSLRQALKGTGVNEQDRADAIEFAHKLLLEYTGILLDQGRRAEARRVLDEDCAGTWVFSRARDVLTRRAAWPVWLWRARKTVARILRGSRSSGDRP